MNLTTVTLLLAVGLCAVHKTAAGPGITGLSGGLDALIKALGVDWCSSHQCANAPFPCGVRCVEWRAKCAHKARGDGKPNKVWKCILERTEGLFRSGCSETIETFINDGHCSIPPSEFA